MALRIVLYCRELEIAVMCLGIGAVYLTSCLYMYALC